MRREPEDSAPRKSVVFTVEIDAGVVASMVEDAPHVGTDSAEVEDVVQRLVDEWPGGDGVVVADVGNVQQKKGLGKAPQQIEGNKFPRTGSERIYSNPTARKDSQPTGDLEP